MASREKQEKPEKAKKSGEEKEEGQEPEQEGGWRSVKRILGYMIVAILVVALVFIAYFLFTNYTSVPFSAFKSGYITAKRVSLAVTYSNLSQYGAESQCMTLIAEFIGKNRPANSTIDLVLINRENASCLYSPIMLGRQINISIQSIGRCLSIANTEPGIFLNYSNQNSTSITLNRLYIYGNSQYMLSCPIAVDLG